MGLDVYLYRYTDRAAVKSRRDEYEKQSEKVWDALGEYSKATEEAKDEASAKALAIATSLGLKEHGEDPEEIKVELASAKYPEHYWKIGYWRSSYNDGGINSVMGTAIGKDLYTIVEPPKDEYEFQPDWAATKKRAAEALDELKESIAKFPFGVSHESEVRPDLAVRSSEAALELFRSERMRADNHGAGFGRDYSNAHGSFWIDNPLEVHAVIHGRSVIGLPCVYIIFKKSMKEYEYYTQALEILMETCDYVMGQEKPEEFWLHWSG